MDIASVLRSVHRDRLFLQDGAARRPVPPWANWFIWLGQWMRAQTALEGRRVAVVRLPTKRLASAFVGLGAILTAARLHDDSLDWDALQSLPKGTTVHWRENKGGRAIAYTGVVGITRELSGTVCMALEIEAPKRYKGGTCFLPKPAALSYGVTLGNVTASMDVRLAAAAELLQAVVDQSSLSWIRSSSADSALVTERTPFLNDLQGLSLSSGEFTNVPLLDALVIADNNSRQHGKLLLVPSRAEVFSDMERGVTVLDGAVAAMRLGSSRARSIILLLDHSEYDEEVRHTISAFLADSTEKGIHLPSDGVQPAPDGVEPFVFGLPTVATISREIK